VAVTGITGATVCFNCYYAGKKGISALQVQDALQQIVNSVTEIVRAGSTDGLRETVKTLYNRN